MKKVLVCVSALAVALSLFAACGKTGGDGPDVCTYTVYCYGAENGEEIGGVVINFCTDTACTPVTSAEGGAAVFTGPPANYHVQIVKIPAGWKLAQEETEWETGPCGETYRIPFRATEP